MGQDIKYIATTDVVEIPLDIVHFREANGCVIPFPIYDDYFQEIAVAAKHAKGPEILFELVQAHPDVSTHVKELFSRLQKLNLRNFVFTGYSEAVEIPQDLGEPIIFVNGEWIPCTQNELRNAHNAIGWRYSTYELVHNESRYWWYYGCERVYNKMHGTEIHLEG